MVPQKNTVKLNYFHSKIYYTDIVRTDVVIKETLSKTALIAVFTSLVVWVSTSGLNESVTSLRQVRTYWWIVANSSQIA